MRTVSGRVRGRTEREDGSNPWLWMRWMEMTSKPTPSHRAKFIHDVAPHYDQTNAIAR